MKRLVTLGITLALVMGLFCFSVNATATSIETVNQRSNSFSVDGVVAKIYGFQLAPNNQGGSTISGSAYVPFYITMQVGNNNNTPVLLSRLGFTMDVTNGNGSHYTLYGIENYTDDLYLSGNQTNIFYVSPSAGFSNNGTGVIIPPKKCLYLVCEVQIAVDLQINGSSITWPTVSWDSLNIRDFTVSDASNLPYEGEPVDFDNIEIFNDMLQALQGIDLDVSDMHTLISNLVDSCTYTGTDPSNLSQNSSIQSISYTIDDNIRLLARRIISAPVYTTIDYEYDATSDSYTEIGTIRYPVTLQLFNYCGNTLRSWNYNILDNFFPNSETAKNFYIGYFYSDIYKTAYNYNRQLQLLLRIKSDTSNSYCIIPSGTHFTVIQGYIEVPIGSEITFSDFNVDNFNNGRAFTVNTDYYPVNEYTILRDLYIAYSSVNGINDLSVAASDAADQAATIHNQEASYYSQNQAAIEATGLSNYQFSGEQTNGIGAVSNDFTALWNALGSWNSVYIFSMTLTLALTILRHMPNRRKPKEEKKE